MAAGALMFVSATIHQALREELAIERAKREVLTQQVESQKLLIDFLCALSNQYGKERAVLLRETTHLDIPIPEIRRAPRTTTETQQLIDALAHASPFRGLEDEQNTVVD